MTKLEQKGSFEVNENINNVYEFLTNPSKVAYAFPIVENVNIIDENSFNVKLKLKIGIIQGSADLKLMFIEKEPPKHAKLIGNGSGLKSTINIQLVFDLKSVDNNKTIIEWMFNGDISGMASSLGTSVLKSTTENIVNQVINNLKKSLDKISK